MKRNASKSQHKAPPFKVTREEYGGDSPTRINAMLPHLTINPNVIRDGLVFDQDHFYKFIKRFITSLSVTAHKNGIHKLVGLEYRSDDATLREKERINLPSHMEPYRNDLVHCELWVNWIPKAIFIGHGFGKRESDALYGAAKDLCHKLHEHDIFSETVFNIIPYANEKGPIKDYSRALTIAVEIVRFAVRVSNEGKSVTKLRISYPLRREMFEIIKEAMKAHILKVQAKKNPDQHPPRSSKQQPRKTRRNSDESSKFDGSREYRDAIQHEDDNRDSNQTSSGVAQSRHIPSLFDSLQCSRCNRFGHNAQQCDSITAIESAARFTEDDIQRRVEERLREKYELEALQAQEQALREQIRYRKAELESQRPSIPDEGWRKSVKTSNGYGLVSGLSVMPANSYYAMPPHMMPGGRSYTADIMDIANECEHLLELIERSIKTPSDQHEFISVYEDVRNVSASIASVPDSLKKSRLNELYEWLTMVLSRIQRQDAHRAIGPPDVSPVPTPSSSRNTGWRTDASGSQPPINDSSIRVKVDGRLLVSLQRSEEVGIGSVVWAQDLRTGTWERCRVLEITNQPNGDYLLLEVQYSPGTRWQKRVNETFREESSYF